MYNLVIHELAKSFAAVPSYKLCSLLAVTEGTTELSMNSVNIYIKRNQND